MTKLFEDDAYLKEFKAKIIGIVKEENRIELDKTAFYAKSGGQPGDTGTIEAESIKIQVLDTIKENNKIINIVDDLKDLEENAEIIGKINWDLRYKHMRMHTALHLLCSIVPLGVTGGQIGYEKSRLDFNDPDKLINKEELEDKINLLVANEITPHLTAEEYMDKGEYENELKQVLGDTRAAFDISEHDTLIFGANGLLIAGPNVC